MTPRVSEGARSSPPVLGSISRCVLTLRLLPEPRSATRARTVTREHLAPACPPEVVETAALLVTELVSNAVLHAATEMLLVVDVEPGRVDLRVQDSSVSDPELQTAEPDAVGGRGLAIVDELATAWGVERRKDTKVVWASLEFPESRETVSER
jgi:anti-sigma regulatory factor (Ser/Thr protein kinase)